MKSKLTFKNQENKPGHDNQRTNQHFTNGRDNLKSTGKRFQREIIEKN